MSNKSNVLLSGNILCGHCGGRLVASRYVDHYKRKDGTVVDICEGRYVCYHRNRQLCQCDGSSTYRAKQIDDTVIKSIREIFSYISGCPEEEKVKEAYKKAVSDNLRLQKKLTGIIEKDKEHLSKLRDEIANTLTGDSIYTPADLSAAIETVRNRISENEQKLSELKDEERSRKAQSDEIIPAYKRFKTWSEEFEGSSLEGKKMIASRLFTRIEVKKGYKVHLTMAPSYRQFCEEWEGNV